MIYMANTTIEKCFIEIKNGANIKQGVIDGGYPITRIESLSNNKFNRDRMGYAGITDLEKYYDYILNDGDLLMSHINSVQFLGRSIVYKKNGDEAIIHGMNLLRLKPNFDLINPHYINLYFFGKKFRTEIARITKKSVNQASFSVTDLKKISILLPTIDIQKAIAEKMESIHKVIEVKKRLLSEYDHLIKSRFVEMFGESKENPKRWRKSKVSDILDVRGRVGWKGYKKEDLRQNGPLVLGATQINQNGDIDLSSPVYLSEEKYVESPEIMLQVNDLVFTQRGNTIGKTGLLEQNIGKATINPCVLILRPLKANPKFLKIYFTLENTIRDMWELNSGSAQPMITQKGIKEYKIINPPIILQDEFADFVVQVDKLKFVVQQSLDETQKLFDSLMQKYFG